MRARVLVPAIVVMVGASAYLAVQAIEARNDRQAKRAVVAGTAELHAAALPGGLRPRTAADCPPDVSLCLETDLGVDAAAVEVSRFLSGLGYRVDPPSCEQDTPSIRSCRVAALRGQVAAVVSVTPRLVGGDFDGADVSLSLLPT